MPNKNIEIELKLPLKNPQEVKEFLNTKAKLQAKNVFQKDTYFTPAHRNFLAARYPFEWLRLREAAKGVSLTYKHFYPENAEKTDYCDEFEIKVDDADSLRNILASLNFKEVVVVEKTRSIWLWQDVEIAIDNVKRLGCFIELEARRYLDNHKKAREYLQARLNQLGARVGPEDLRGYPFRILEKQEDR